MPNLLHRSLFRPQGFFPWCRILKTYILISKWLFKNTCLSTITLCLVLWQDIIILITVIISIWWLFGWTLVSTICVFNISFGFFSYPFLFTVWIQFIRCQWSCLAICGRIFPFWLRWFWNRIRWCIYKTSYIGRKIRWSDITHPNLNKHDMYHTTSKQGLVPLPAELLTCFLIRFEA